MQYGFFSFRFRGVAILGIDHYLNYLARFVKPGGVIAIAGAGLNHEIEDSVPDHLQQWWASEPSMWSLHSPAW